MQKTELKEMLEEVLDEVLKKGSSKEWMSLSEAAEYIGVSYNTLMKFRLDGLKVAEVDRIKRISKTDIDIFLKEYSY